MSEVTVEHDTENSDQTVQNKENTSDSENEQRNKSLSNQRRRSTNKHNSNRSKSAPNKKCGEPSERIQYLANPKRYQIIRLSNFGRKLWMGTQDQLWGVSEAARNGSASPRVEELATPKKNFQTGLKVNRPEYTYSCGRNSQIWEVSPLAMQGEATERVSTLAQHKNPPPNFQEGRPHFVYSCGRSSPLWPISKGAQQCDERPHTAALAKPKFPPKEFEGEQAVIRELPKSALNARCSPRVEYLANPKNRPEGPFRDPLWPVTKATLRASATNRNFELSKYKILPEGYQYDRFLPIEIQKATKRAIASSRTEALSVPIIRATMDHIIFDPDAFLVKDAAKHAYCSNRIKELSVPLVR